MHAHHSRSRVPRLPLYGAIAALLLVVTVLLPATGPFNSDLVTAEDERTVEGTVLRVEATRAESQSGTLVEERIEVAVDDDVHTIERTRLAADPVALEVDAGDEVLLSVRETPEGERYALSDRVRRFPLWTLTLAFAALVLAVGWWRGATSLVALAASVLVLGRFVVPGILAGLDPVAIAIAGSLVILATTLVIAHGASVKTLVALGGTALSLGLTAALGAFAIGFASLTGAASDDAATLLALTGGSIDATGLLLAGVIIGALGVLDDVTSTQASAVFELHDANPALRARDLFSRGMNVGRDHIAATVNTLVLAYAGAGLPLLLILAGSTESFTTLVNRDLLATEVVRAVVGSVGIVAAVPLTTALAAWVTEWMPPSPPAAPRTLAASRADGGGGEGGSPPDAS